MPEVELQIAAIKELMLAAEEVGLPLWLDGGWAVDARLGAIQREHGDIDVAFPADRRVEIEALVERLGYHPKQVTDYGFIVAKGDVELDLETCVKDGDDYGFEGYPPGSCPLEPEGDIDGFSVRCVSWEAMYVEKINDLEEIPQDDWRDKDRKSLEIITNHISAQVREELKRFVAKSRS